MTPIERAARQLCLIDGVDPDSSLGGDGQNFLWMEYAEVEVKAVLEAIREPSEAMMEAGMTASDNGGAETSAWQAMIDAALKER